ncbi:MAG: glycosyltransferase family 39 protein [Elusimicrobiota bacterium]
MLYKSLISNEKKFIVFIFLLSLFIKVVYVLQLSPQKLSPDAYDWMNIASGIASGNGYGDVWRPPVYPLFLASIFSLFGKSVVLLRLINSLMCSVTCILIYFIGKKIFSSTVGKVSAILLCFYPYTIAYAGDLISETFYAFLISVSILSILICYENPNLKNTIFTGIVLGITTLTKSTILPFFLFACAWLWWTTKSFRTGFLLGIFILITIAPWTLRNYIHYKQFILISPAYQTLWSCNNDTAMILETTGELDTPAPDWNILPDRFSEYIKLPRMESEKIFKKEAIEWIKNNPEKYRWLMKKRLIHFWRLYPMMAYKWQKIVAFLTSGMYILLCWVGVVLSIKKFKKTSLLIFLLIIFTLAYLPFVVVIRYRVPLDPYIIIFASYTIHFIWTKLKSFILSRV